MTSKANNNTLGPFERVMLFVFLAAVLLLVFSSCSPRIVEKVRVQHDTTYVSKLDSVYFYDRDSVFVREKGDTVYKYVEKWRYRDRWRVDTVLKVRVDSVAYEAIKEVKVEQPLSWWQKAKLGSFWWLLGAVVALVLWTFRKVIF